MSVEKAHEIIFNRISPEIFLAKQSASIWQNIGAYSSQLNGTAHQKVFGIVQTQALSSLVLSLGKLFERPCKKYPNYSIPTTIAHLKENIQNVPLNMASVGKLVDDLKDDAEDRLYLLKNIHKIPQILLKEFEKGCPRQPARPGFVLDISFEKVKVTRDKQVAHMEDTDVRSLPSTDWDAVRQLLAFGETFVNLVGYGFFGFSRKGRINSKDLELLNQPSGNQLRNMLEIMTSK